MDYDYIIVGGGSSGCVAAGRLVSEFGARVLLLEEGTTDDGMLFRMPAGFVKFLQGSPHLTFHKTAPQKALGGRQLELPTGRVLGGGSSVNAQVYIRGQIEDYDDWAEAAGGQGSWRFSDLVPYFRVMEANQRLNNEFHGVEGPLKVSDHSHRSPLSHAFVAAAQGWGLEFSNDFNGGRQNGVGYIQLTTGNGRRCSAVDAFLRPVLRNPLLTVATNAKVAQLVMEKGRVIGVTYRHGSEVKTAKAKQEVLLCAGALATPQLMMLSGIGPEAELAKHNIQVKHRLEGVGLNLQDHHEVPVMASVKGKLGYFNEDKGVRMVANGLQYLLLKSGPVTSNGVESCAFLDPDGKDRPSIQMFCVPSIYADRGTVDVDATYGITLNSCILRPKTRGKLTLRSADPGELPIVDPGYLQDPEDLRLSIAGLRIAREILRENPLRDLVKEELLPGPAKLNDSDLAEHCRRLVKTDYHPVGTCRMGREDDEMAVLTPDLKVRGIEGLRVLDTSMMPNLISGNTNATALAVAYKAIDMMMDRTPPIKPTRNHSRFTTPRSNS